MKDLLVQKIYDLLIVGAGTAGLQYLKQNYKKFANVGVVCRDDKNKIINLANKYNTVDFIKQTVLYASYYHGLITLEVEDNHVILCKQLVIATETKPDDKHVAYKYYHKFAHSDIKEDSVIVIIGDSSKSSDAAKFAIECAKKAKQVYFIDSSFKLKCGAADRCKISNIKNLQRLAGTTVAAVQELKSIKKVCLDNFDVLACTDIYMFDFKIPETFTTVVGLYKKDMYGHILVNKDNQTTIVPTIYAIGGCSKEDVGGNLWH